MLLLLRVLFVSARMGVSPNAVHMVAAAADFRLSERIGGRFNPPGVRRTAVIEAVNVIAGRSHSNNSATIMADTHVGKSGTRLSDPVTAVTTLAVKNLMF
jgi:hypothetical protein